MHAPGQEHQTPPMRIWRLGTPGSYGCPALARAWITGVLEGVLTRSGCSFGFLFGFNRLGGSALHVSGGGTRSSGDLGEGEGPRDTIPVQAWSIYFCQLLITINKTPKISVLKHLPSSQGRQAGVASPEFYVPYPRTRPAVAEPGPGTPGRHHRRSRPDENTSQSAPSVNGRTAAGYRPARAGRGVLRRYGRGLSKCPCPRSLQRPGRRGSDCSGHLRGQFRLCQYRSPGAVRARRLYGRLRRSHARSGQYYPGRESDRHGAEAFGFGRGC